jgi:hypothetical protein
MTPLRIKKVLKDITYTEKQSISDSSICSLIVLVLMSNMCKSRPECYRELYDLHGVTIPYTRFCNCWAKVNPVKSPNTNYMPSTGEVSVVYTDREIIEECSRALAMTVITYIVRDNSSDVLIKTITGGSLMLSMRLKMLRHAYLLAVASVGDDLVQVYCVNGTHARDTYLDLMDLADGNYNSLRGINVATKTARKNILKRYEQLHKPITKEEAASYEDGTHDVFPVTEGDDES